MSLRRGSIPQPRFSGTTTKKNKQSFVSELRGTLEIGNKKKKKENKARKQTKVLAINYTYTHTHVTI